MFNLNWVLERTGARGLTRVTVLQQLWGGCGQLLRLHLDPGPSVILKHVVPPRGDSPSDRRKRRSYEVEQAWYLGPARECDPSCRVARCLGAHPGHLLLEDLEGAGYRPGRARTRPALRWLAHFHARFLGRTPPGLWEQGTYWHLGTRREEWSRMRPGPLRDEADELDRRLRGARFQTLVHGDAKPANFLWGPEGAAAVDFQYVGPGCGIRDVAYYLDGADGELDAYFAFLRQARPLPDGLEAEWRELYPVACRDFERFEAGWRVSHFRS